MYKVTTLVTIGTLALVSMGKISKREAFLRRVLQDATTGTEAPPPLEYSETLKCD